MADDLMSVDDLAGLDAVYNPFTVMYRDIGADRIYCLLVFAESAAIAGHVVEDFYITNDINGTTLQISLMDVQCTIVQRTEAEPCPSATDELDDPIRWSSKH